MAQAFDTLAAIFAHGFDTLIDVRAPAEYAEDHIPGAINLPVLSDTERARVGTIYKQQSPFLARKVGGALVARNAAGHIEGPLADHDGAWRPLVYCWRGGQRSGSFTTILQQIGWRADVIEGGYRTYRRMVKDALYDTPLPLRLILLDGYTGTAKTDLLYRLQSRGVQMIDLEGLAHHRGSVLGARDGGQPSQKALESGLAGVLVGLDPARPVVVEAESNKVGDLNVPPSLWALMQDAPRIEVTSSVDERAKYLAEAYSDMIDDPDEFKTRLRDLTRLRGHDVVASWLRMVEDHDAHALARDLMERHYDPAYAKSRARTEHQMLGTVHADRLDENGREQLADQISEIVSKN